MNVHDAVCSTAALPGSPSGYTVTLSSGTFTESGVLELLGVDLVAGSTNTTIKSTLRTAASGTFDQDRWSLQARSNSMTGSGHAQSIKGFTLDGDSWQALGSLLVEIEVV